MDSARIWRTGRKQNMGTSLPISMSDQGHTHRKSSFPLETARSLQSLRVLVHKAEMVLSMVFDHGKRRCVVNLCMFDWFPIFPPRSMNPPLPSLFRLTRKPKESKPSPLSMLISIPNSATAKNHRRPFCQPGLWKFVLQKFILRKIFPDKLRKLSVLP